MEKDENGDWHAFLDDIQEGQKYGYRSHGEYNPENRCFFNPNKLLVDPYARQVTRSLHDLTSEEREMLCTYNDVDTASIAPKSVVRFFDKKSLAEKYPFLYKKPEIPLGQNHIYEMHVGNFTAHHPDIPEEKRGKLSAISRTVNYLKALSYNQIELLPITATMSDKHLLREKDLSDQWGYKPINHFSVDPRYGSIDDLLQLVNDLHANGIEVSLDVVYNHTGEGGRDSFSLSYKGLDPDSYYRFSPENGYSFINTSGCGNGFNPNTEQGNRILRDSLMFFSDVCGVDAFRFDLAADCCLDNHLQYNPESPFLKVIKSVRDKTGAKMSGEPWSALGGYYLGRMKDDLHEWNDRHEKVLRQFLRGEEEQVGTLAYYMAGGNANGKINIFTKHDGATQYDWATYSHKNNYENNEENRDGSNDNHYSPSANDDHRLKKTKSAHALNVLARGIPLSLNGDELWYTQRGNNNGYAKKFPLQWKNFTYHQRERYLFERKINAFRQQHPVFSSIENASSEIMPNGKPSWDWVNINGDRMQESDWNCGYNRFLAYVLNGQNKEGKLFDDDFLVMMSGNPDFAMDVRLPKAPNNGCWQVVFDTSLPTSHKFSETYDVGDVYHIQPQSVVVMTCKRDRTEEQTRTKPFNIHFENQGR